MPTPSSHPQPSEYAYAIYPSLLDGFQSFLDAEHNWGQWWGNAEEPAKSADEYAAECEKELIDKINRCPKVPIEVVDRGTAVNEVVDMLIHNRPCQIPGMAIDPNSEAHPGVVKVSYNGFTWEFSTALLISLHKRYPNAISQYCVGAPLQTSYGWVWLYGYLDEWVGNKIYDIKTTGSYTFGKYERKWQKHVYPYAVVESGDCTEIKEFEYTAVELSKPTEKQPVIHGKIYPEIYSNDHEQNRRLLCGICEQFIEWLEYRRGLITDRKIFGGENPDSYVGEPIDIKTLIEQ